MRGLSRAYTGGNVYEVFGKQLSSRCLRNDSSKSEDRFSTGLIEVKDTEVNPYQNVVLDS
jgi:hypothetical protein